MPLRPLVVALVVVSAVLAGCTKKADEGTPTAPTGPTTPTTNRTVPHATPLAEKGSIQGPFEKSWKIALPAIAPRSFVVDFNLTGAQAGAPPTAVVNLVLSGPDAKTIKSATVGLGQAANSVAWTLGPAEAALAGDYALKATSQASTPAPAGVPSGGVADYAVYMAADY